MNLAKLISLGEKSHYPFKSYPTVRCETLLFPGCAFPSQFPRTMDALALLCRRAGFGVAYDCCGHPVAGYGDARGAERIAGNLNRRLAKLGCKRAVLACPNCLQHLKGKLECEVVSVFDVLGELGVGNAGSFGRGVLFVPCPDKGTRALEGAMRGRYDLSGVETMGGVGCCGLRPDIAARGPAVVEKMGGLVVDKARGARLYTYCASCLGQFARMGCRDCRHVVSVLLGVDEPPDSARALANRARRALDRDVNPL